MTHTATSASGSSRGHEAKLASTSGPDRGRHEAYETDIVSRGWTTLGIVAVVGVSIFTTAHSLPESGAVGIDRPVLGDPEYGSRNN